MGARHAPSQSVQADGDSSSTVYGTCQRITDNAERKGRLWLGKTKKEIRMSEEAFVKYFWSVYPKRQGKAAALKRWDSMKLDEQGELIYAHLTERVKRDKKWKDGYIPMPTTFLNQKRWEDEYDTDRPKNHAMNPPTASSALHPEALPQPCHIKARLNLLIFSAIRRHLGVPIDCLREMVAYRNRVAGHVRDMGELTKEDGEEISRNFVEEVERIIKQARA